MPLCHSEHDALSFRTPDVGGGIPIDFQNLSQSLYKPVGIPHSCSRKRRVSIRFGMTKKKGCKTRNPAATGFCRDNAVRASAAKVLRILAFVFLPLVGQIVGGEDGRHRTDGNARAAVDTLDRVDKKLLRFAVRTFVLLRVDAVHRACIDARRVLGAYAGFCDYVCHFCFLSNEKRRE